MSAPNALVREMRSSAGLSQRALAGRANTSQPAIARYERGAATPSWETLERIASSCGRRLCIAAEPELELHDVELAKSLLALEPWERLQALRRFARLRHLAEARR